MRMLKWSIASCKQAMLAKCHECMGEYVDGRRDCEVLSCPWYSRMPYRRAEPDLKWTAFNPRRVGRVERKPLTDEQRTALVDRLRRIRLRNVL